jgi:hypothetical protein
VTQRKYPVNMVYLRKKAPFLMFDRTLTERPPKLQASNTLSIQYQIRTINALYGPNM